MTEENEHIEEEGTVVSEEPTEESTEEAKE